MAAVYEPLAWLWSGGRIGRARKSLARWIEPMDRVAIVGCGTGAELTSIWQRQPTAVLAIDTSPRMLARAARRGTPTACVADDFQAFLAHDPRAQHGFDAVVLSFFLNLFEAPDAIRHLRRVASHLRPGGRILIADFAPPTGGRWRHTLQELNWSVPLAIYRRWIGGGTRHRLHDLDAILADAGLVVRARVQHPWLGLAGYTAWCVTPTEATTETGAAPQPPPGQ